MKKTKWFLGTGIVMALLVVVAVFTKQPTQATAAEDAAETYQLAQVGTTEYSKVYYDNYVNVLQSSDNKTYTVVMNDGKIATIDNTQTNYTYVQDVTSGSSYNVLGAHNDDNQMKFVTVTGKEYANGTGFHERVAFTDNLTTGDFAGSFYTLDGNNCVVYDKAGNKVTAYTVPDNTSLHGVIRYQDHTVFVNFEYTNRMNKYISVNASGTTREVLSGVSFSRGDEKVIIGYVGFKEITYYNSNFEKITSDEAWALLGSSSSTKKPNYNGSGSISASEAPELEDGYIAYMKWMTGRFTLYVGHKYDGQTKTTAYFNPSGKKLADNIYTVMEDAEMVITRDTTGENTYVYKLYKLLKSGETLKVEYYTDPEDQKPVEDTTVVGTGSQTTVANDEVVSATTEIQEKTDGTVEQNLQLDDVDGSKEVIEVAAAKGVIPAGAKMNISKIKSGEKYEEVQKAVENVANKAVVFEIDLFNSENVKVQPNGNIQFTLDVPSGFATEKVNVYRVEDDGTLTKMESEIVDGKVVFVTNHFSTYVITEDKEVAATSGDSVETGDTTPVVIYLIAALGALSFLLVVSKKRIVK